MVKHLVTSGCSFTRLRHPYNGDNVSYKHSDASKDTLTYHTYAHHLANKKGLILHNEGHPTFDNSAIVNTIIQKVTSLLKQGVSSEEIYVIVQFTSAVRFSFLIDKELAKQKDYDVAKVGVGHTAQYLTKSDSYYENGYAFLGSGSPPLQNEAQYRFNKIYDGLLDNYNATFLMARNIHHLQSFLKLHNIKYSAMFMLNQVVSNSSYPFSNHRDLGFYKKDLHNIPFGELASNQFIPFNKNETEIWNEKGFGYWDIFLDDIDWKPFWFFNNDAHKFGGVFEWSYTKFDKDKLLYTWHEEESSQCKTKEEMISWLNKEGFQGYHPSSALWDIFVEEELIPHINKTHPNIF